MSGAHRADAARSRPRRPLAGLVLAGAVLLGATGGLGTLAYWNDTEIVAGGTIKAGSLDLTVEGVQGPYIWSALQMDAIAPGESVAAELSIENAGSTPFTVVMTGSATGGLAPHVTTTAYVGSVATSDDAYPRKETCEGGSPGMPRTLTAEPQPVASTGVVEPATGPGSGVQKLCVVLALPATALDGAQGQSITPRFTLTATQVQP